MNLMRGIIMIEQFYDAFKRWSNTGTVWMISDTHFMDKNLTFRTVSADDIVKSINSKVGKKDTLIILGDIGDIAYAQRLKGYKVLIMGNHDVGPSHYKKVDNNNLFDEVYEGPVIVGEKLIFSHEPLNIDWAFNIHGHIHDKHHTNDEFHFNVCCDVIDYTPLNLNQFVKSGVLKHIKTLHRNTIDTATKRKKNRIKK